MYNEFKIEELQSRVLFSIDIIDPTSPILGLNHTLGTLSDSTSLNLFPSAVEVRNKAYALHSDLTGMSIYNSKTDTWSDQIFKSKLTPSIRQETLSASVGKYACFVYGGVGSSLLVYNTSNGHYRTIEITSGTYQMVSSGNHLLLPSSSTEMEDYNVVTGKLRKIKFVEVIEGVFAINGALFGVSGSRVFHYNLKHGVWNEETGVVNQSISEGQGGGITTTGRFIVFFSINGFETLDTVTDTWTNYGGGANVSGTLFSLGNKLILGGTQNGMGAGLVKVLDLSTGQTASTRLANNDDRVATTTYSFGNRAYFAGGEYILLGGGTKAPSTSIDIFTDTTPTAVLSGGLTGRPGHTVTVQLFNTGDAPLVSGAVVKLYATQSRGMIDGSSILLGSKPTTSALAASDNRTLRVSTKIPGTMAGGSYYLVAAVDDGKTVTPIASSETSYKITTKTTAAISRAFTRLFRR